MRRLLCMHMCWVFQVCIRIVEKKLKKSWQWSSECTCCFLWLMAIGLFWRNLFVIRLLLLSRHDRNKPITRLQVWWWSWEEVRSTVKEEEIEKQILLEFDWMFLHESWNDQRERGQEWEVNVRTIRAFDRRHAEHVSQETSACLLQTFSRHIHRKKETEDEEIKSRHESQNFKSPSKSWQTERSHCWWCCIFSWKQHALENLNMSSRKTRQTDIGLWTWKCKSLLQKECKGRVFVRLFLQLCCINEDCFWDDELILTVQREEWNYAWIAILIPCSDSCLWKDAASFFVFESLEKLCKKNE